MDDLDQLMSLRKQGFFCSQILILQGLDMMGKSNPDLVPPPCTGWQVG